MIEKATSCPSYFECHVTIEPVFDLQLAMLKNVCEIWGFRVADLVKWNFRDVTPERSDRDSFCTTRGQDYDDVYRRMDELTKRLGVLNFDVWRRKIEFIVLDERYPDHSLGT